MRALETAWDGEAVQPSSRFTRAFHPTPKAGFTPSMGLIAGFHDPVTTHLAILSALAGPEAVRGSYEEATDHRYLWHESGERHLPLT